MSTDGDFDTDSDESVVDEGFVRRSTKRSPGLVHKIEWVDDVSRFIKNFQSEVPFDSLKVDADDVDTQESDKPPFEIVTRVWGSADSNLREASQETNALNMPTPPPGPTGIKDVKIRKIGRTRMIIRSQRLLKIIRGCVKYFPAKTLSSDAIELYKPYDLLIHHLDSLEEAGKDQDLEEESSRHLQSMLEYLKEYIIPRISHPLHLLRRPEPVVKFKNLWLLFKPGSELYWHRDTEHLSSIVFSGIVLKTELIRPTKSEREDGKKDRWSVSFWILESDGTFLGRELIVRDILKFSGERQVTSLPVYPCTYFDSLDGGKTRQAVVERGKKAYQILREMPKQMWYDGFTDKKRLFLMTEKYRGNCIIDIKTYLSRNDETKTIENEIFTFLHNELTFRSENSDMLSQALSEAIFASFHHINISNTPSLPTDSHYFLIGPIIAGFALFDKAWKVFCVEWLHEIQITMAMDSLIIDPINRNIVQAITYAQSYPFQVDHAHNKGEGQVVLLHGPPGVGKTYTVECIAQSTGRPLIALAMGHLMRNEDEVEEVLISWFSLAEHWKAILLLDEADIFLERRATRDIKRNGIVSIFLRRMEYFSGLLFLTTNRVGQIDDAFLSRVSVVLQYDQLNNETRKKIWHGFFKRLHEDAEKIPGARKIEVDSYARNYVLHDQEVSDMLWNGREIRNALQTAVSLASYEAFQEGKSSGDLVKVEQEHFRSVVSMSRKFKEYMRGISGMEEDERAKARKDRTNPG
ncbi:MAG: hypothetical protein Q9214_004591 [Letrouitia sp. 1 TL-2023]